MLKFYYTVASAYDAPQDVPVNSVGGYKSSTPISNDLLDSVFDELSLRGMADGQPQYKAIVLVNEGTEAVTNLQLWFSTPEDQVTYCNFTVAATQMSTDAEGNPIMERSPNMYSKPYYAQFFPATEEEKASLGDLQPGGSIGIWLCRTPNKEIIKKDYDNVAEVDQEKSFRTNIYKPVEKEKEEIIFVNLSWD